MIVYIEYAILDNITIDSILLYLVGLTIGKNVKWWRILLTSALGTVCALVVPLVSVWIGYVVKVVCVVGMCIVCFGRQRLLVSTLLLVAYTFTLGGLLIGLLSILGVDYTIYSTGYSYYSSVPIGMYIIAVVLCIVLVASIVCYIKGRHSSYANTIDVVVMLGGEHVSCAGYIDSGNLLAVQGVPVCFVCGAVGKKLQHHIALAVMSGSSVGVQYNTMSGSGSTVAVAGSLAIGSSIHTVLFCVGRGSSVHGCDVLINYKVVEGQQ